ncbi:MAG: imidazole glycerol phosphate synthase subunit HisH [Chloroflexota bacterium]
MIQKTITMIDYGGSNLRSAQKAFEYVGAVVDVTADPDTVRRAEKLVLPGVGAFGAGMAAIRRRGLEPAIQAAAQQGTPLLGICLGMQYLFDSSEEMGHHTGLGLIAGRVRRFDFDGGPKTEDGEVSLRPPSSVLRLKIPHMGWNQIEATRASRLLAGIAAGSYAYFVHSYYCDPAAETAVLAHTDYGHPFAAIVAQDNIYGIQFHPEKSQAVGLRILQNYLTL